MMNSLATCSIAILLRLLLLLPSLVSATAGNLTISFTTNATPSECSGRDQSKELLLTTAGTPYAYTCFNISDIFSQSNTTGFQLGEGADTIIDPTGSLGALGVNYTLGNLDLYSPSNNYTQVMLTQVNLTRDQAGEGKPSGRRINVYSLLDCQQMSKENGGDDPAEYHPWYLQSCQTAASGNCHVVTQGIQSFSIQGESASQCANWAFLSGASTFSQRSTRGISVLVAIVTLWVML